MKCYFLPLRSQHPRQKTLYTEAELGTWSIGCISLYCSSSQWRIAKWQHAGRIDTVILSKQLQFWKIDAHTELASQYREVHNYDNHFSLPSFQHELFGSHQLGPLCNYQAPKRMFEGNFACKVFLTYRLLPWPKICPVRLDFAWTGITVAMIADDSIGETVVAISSTFHQWILSHFSINAVVCVTPYDTWQPLHYDTPSRNLQIPFKSRKYESSNLLKTPKLFVVSIGQSSFPNIMQRVQHKFNVLWFCSTSQTFEHQPYFWINSHHCKRKIFTHDLTCSHYRLAKSAPKNYNPHWQAGKNFEFHYFFLEKELCMLK